MRFIPGWLQADSRIGRLLPRIFVIFALVIQTCLALLTPPLFAPDEHNHAQRGVEISRGEWIGQKGPEGARALLDTNLIALVHNVEDLELSAARFVLANNPRTNGRVTEAELERSRSLRWSHGYEYSNLANTAAFPPPLYLPAALGWKIGEAADLTIVHSLLLARLMNVLLSVAIGWLALRLAGRERWFIFAYLLIPADMSLSASCSQDALVAPLLALAIVLIMRALSARRMLSATETVTVTALLAICIAARPPYLPLVVLLLLPVMEAGRLRSRDVLGPLGGIAVIFVLVAGWQLSVHPLGLFHLQTASPPEQVAFIKARPAHAAGIIVRHSVKQVPVTLINGLDLLNTNDVAPSVPVVALLLLSYAGVILFAPRVTVSKWSSYILLLASLVVIVLGVSAAEYLIWTPPGADAVFGLQARYYIPLLPAAFLLLPEPKWTFLEPVRPYGLVASVAVLLVIVGYTPWLAARRIYRVSLPAALRASVR